MENRQLTVSEFSNYISSILDSEILLKNVSIVGEIASFNISGGIAYFQIKDQNALLQCILFDAKSHYNPQIGEKVIVTGSPNYYIKTGKFSFKCFQIKPFGMGDLYKQFELLKQKLSDEGLFDITHKKQKPEIIKRIGVVTSKQGAVIQDIINVATRRDQSISIILFPSKVQGLGSEYEISEGINFFNNYDVDAVIVARGGGSKEELAPFNTEVVARSTYNCNKFIVSAVGHETDYTIIDYVADLRAPTPSAAAELLTVDKSKEIEILKGNIDYINILFAKKLEKAQIQLENNITQLISAFSFKLNEKKSEFCQNFEKINDSLNFKIDSIISENEKNMDILNLANPAIILNKGYAKIEKNSKNIASVKELNFSDKIKIILADGEVRATIDNENIEE